MQVQSWHLEINASFNVTPGAPPPLTLVPAGLYTTVLGRDGLYALGIQVAEGVSLAFWVCLLMWSETAQHSLGPFDGEHGIWIWESTGFSGCPKLASSQSLWWVTKQRDQKVRFLEFGRGYWLDGAIFPLSAEKSLSSTPKRIIPNAEKELNEVHSLWGVNDFFSWEQIWGWGRGGRS